jgi:hypothetical protein
VSEDLGFNFTEKELRHCMVLNHFEEEKNSSEIGNEGDHLVGVEPRPGDQTFQALRPMMKGNVL